MRVALLAFLLSSSAFQVSAAGEAVEGRRLAERWCVSCHGATDAAPPLEALANRPNRTAYTLRAWLTQPHPPMPDLSLTREEIDDLVAYLAELAKPR